MRTIVACFLFLIDLSVSQAVEAPEFYWSKYHHAMKEPALASAKTADGDFQFRWTRLSGSGEPLSIRVWQTNGHGFARSVRLEYRYDYSAGDITRDQKMALSDKQLAQLHSYLTSAEFWRPHVESDRFLGGVHWLFELRDSSGYHFVSLFSPALLAGDSQYHKTRQDMSRFRRYIRAASFLLRTTNILPDEHEASY